jgi:hypothetical protein
MKVNDPKLANLMSTQVGGPQATESAGDKHKKTDGVGSGSGDQVNLSALGDKVRALDTESPERAAYLEKLSSDVQAGRYNPDPAAVSRKIVSDAMGAPSIKQTD